MTSSIWFRWWPRSALARVMLVTYALLALGGLAYYSAGRWRKSQARFDDWTAEQHIERRLDRLVEMKFAREPTFDEWLDEWSRQAGLPVERTEYHPDKKYPLQLNPLPAREALQSFCRIYEMGWSLTESGVAVEVLAFGGPVETHSYPLPLRGVDARTWEAMADRFGPEHLPPHSIIQTPGFLQIAAQHHEHVQLASFFQQLTVALAQTDSLTTFTSANDPAWQPRYLESDPAALAQTVQLLQRPVTIDVQQVSLREFARQLAKQLQHPVLIDPELNQFRWIDGGLPLSCQVRDVPLGSLRVPVNVQLEQFVPFQQVQIVPAASGHVLMVCVDPFADETSRQFTFAYPVGDLLSPHDPTAGDRLRGLIKSLLNRDSGTGGDTAVIGNLLLVHDVFLRQQHIQAILTTLREARSGLTGLSSRSRLLPPIPPPTNASLTQPAELIYLDVPLTEVVADLKKRFSLPLELSQSDFAQEIKIWCHLPKQPLRENLERMLSPYILTFVEDPQRIQIVPQFEALRVDRSGEFEFETFNVRNLQRHSQGAREVAEMLLDFADDFNFRRSGGDGVVATFGNLLVLKEGPETLDRVQQLFATIQAEAFVAPSQVRARALRNQSAPFLKDPELWNTTARLAWEHELQAKLKQPVTVAFSQTKAQDVLLALARQHQLPVVYPGYQHTDIAVDAELTFNVRDEPLQAVLKRLLPVGNTRDWIVAKNGTLQTWHTEFLPKTVYRERWLFNVSDLVQPAGPVPLHPGPRQWTLEATLFGEPSHSRDSGLSLYLRRYLAVHGTQQECRLIQQALHDLRTGKLQPLLDIPAPPNPSEELE